MVWLKTDYHLLMAMSLTCIDELIRDYFCYRNFVSTSRVFDNEIVKLPLGHHRTDRMIEQLNISIQQLDISHLIDYWTQIEQRLLMGLDSDTEQLIHVFTKIRLNLYRCYLIHAVQLKRTEKITEFFDRLTKTLQQSSEWTKEWFALPFMKDPEDNAILQIYFSKQWNELFWISLQNFLTTAFYHLTSPKICSLEDVEENQRSTNEQQHPTILSKLREKFPAN